VNASLMLPFWARTLVAGAISNAFRKSAEKRAEEAARLAQEAARLAKERAKEEARLEAGRRQTRCCASCEAPMPKPAKYCTQCGGDTFTTLGLILDKKARQEAAIREKKAQEKAAIMEKKAHDEALMLYEKARLQQQEEEAKKARQELKLV
jgi:RNA polymerase subunit RPABC4/transcription elongation factor Spt4